MTPAVRPHRIPGFALPEPSFPASMVWQLLSQTRARRCPRLTVSDWGLPESSRIPLRRTDQPSQADLARLYAFSLSLGALGCVNASCFWMPQGRRRDFYTPGSCASVASESRRCVAQRLLIAGDSPSRMQSVNKSPPDGLAFTYQVHFDRLCRHAALLSRTMATTDP